MSIDDIKPTGFGQRSYPSAETTGESKPDRNFADVQKTSTGAGIATGASSAAAAKLTSADLQDPDKLNQAVKDTATELVESQTSGTSLSANDKRALADYMSDDPVLRQNIETYLRKAVS
ncbi:MAG TPA: hypothetical protein VHW45_14775 [Candidatus Sulfotelmatobacter sp.]|jgi:hypothetical protein|nr:hypothetical protein [Candidatus Sulfotelmatobacter sp.]